MIKFKGKLKPFQEEGLAFAKSHPYHINNFQAGLGKTITSLAMACHVGKKTLIICPAFLKNNWIKEIEKFNVLPKKTLLLRDGFYWNIERNELYKNNSIVKLTKKERDILKIIFANASIHKITTYDALLYPIWDESNELTLKSLKTFMTTIRKKLPEETIINEYSLGYKVIC